MKRIKSLTLEANDKKAAAIQEARKAAELLSAQSEEFRKALDELEASLNKYAALGCQLEKSDRMRQRVQDIRERRNGMECFALKCLVVESLDAAWKELP